MAITGLPNPKTERPRSRALIRRPWLVGSVCILLVAAMAGIFFVGENWPYRHRKILPLLEDVFGSQVAIAQYHRTYLPHPGFVATGLTLRRKSAPHQPPIGTVQTLFVQGSWFDLLCLRRRVQLVDMTGVHLVLPAPGSRAAKEDFPQGSTADFAGPDTAVSRLVLHSSVIDVLRTGGGRFSFPIAELRLDDVQKGHAMSWAVEMDNAVPSGHIRASGRFGPLVEHAVGETLVTGQFTFDRVNLHDVGNIHGTLSSSGRFLGKLGALEAESSGETPNFSVDDGKATPVAGSIRCTVDALNGDTVFHSVDLRVGRTIVNAVGETAGTPQKSTNLDITVKSGRAEDVLRPFVRREVPVIGPVSLRAHAYLAPSSVGGFFHRLKVDGVFDVPAERATNPETEKSLTAFSHRAQAKNRPSQNHLSSGPDGDALSSIAGPASIRDEIVTTSGLQFKVPGAEADLKGTFAIHSLAVHLAGDLTMETDVSHAATGFKSLLLKPLAPFFKKKNAGAVIPIVVTGTPGKYRVEQDLGHKN
jgi:AsmA-like protein